VLGGRLILKQTTLMAQPIREHEEKKALSSGILSGDGSWLASS
jgi:hypothetical protein